jgi:hypothetical protein
VIPRRFLTIAVIAVVSLVALRAIQRRVLPLLPEDRCRTNRFDAVVWRDSARAYSHEAARGCMVDHLLRTVELKGQTRAAVVALLGEPRPTDYFDQYDLVYWLGPERGLMSVDSEWLVLELDPNDLVVDRQLVTD